MKKLLILVVFLCTLAALSAETKTLLSLSQELNIPPKKLAQYIDGADYETKTKEFEISEAKIKEIKTTYEEKDKLVYSSSIVLVGMSVVFFSLVLCGFVIAQLKHFGKPKKEKKTKVVKKAEVKAEPKPDVSGDALVAAICALHLHIKETEEKNSILLTWKRTPISMWSSESRTKMPNAEFYRRRG